MGKAGRPSKLTIDVVDRIVAAIKGGNFRYVAAMWAGVSQRTMHEWMAAGKAKPKGKFGDFRRRVLSAEKEAEITAVNHIRRAAATDPRHAEWWLERKFPQRWGRRERHELTGKGGGPIRHESRTTVDLSKLSDAEMEALEAIASKLENDSEPEVDSDGTSH